MGLKQDVASAEAYISRANRRIARQHKLITRSRDRETVAVAEDLMVILSTLRANVERRREQLPTEG
jgi:hypothetical protein